MRDEYIPDYELYAQYISVDDCGYFPMLFSREYCPFCLEQLILSKFYGNFKLGILLFNLASNPIYRIYQSVLSHKYDVAENELLMQLDEYDDLKSFKELLTSQQIYALFDFIIKEKRLHTASIKLGTMFLGLLDTKFHGKVARYSSEEERKNTIKGICGLIEIFNSMKVPDWASWEKIDLSKIQQENGELVAGGRNILDHYCAEYNRIMDESAEGSPKYIKQIYVRNLFGNLSYSLNVNQDLSIVIGPNGLGKTTVCRLMETLLVPADDKIDLDVKFNFLKDTPFKEFGIVMCDDSSIKVSKSNTKLSIDYIYPDSQSYFDEISGGLEISLCEKSGVLELSRHFQFVQYLFPRLGDAKNNQFCFVQTNRTLDLERLKTLFELYDQGYIAKEKVINQFSQSQTPKFVNDFRQKVNSLWNVLGREILAIDKISIEKKDFYKFVEVLDSELFNEDVAGGSIEKFKSHLLCYSNMAELRSDGLSKKNRDRILRIINVAIRLLENYKIFVKSYESIYYDGDPAQKFICVHNSVLAVEMKAFDEFGKEKIVKLDFSQLSSGEINLAAVLFAITFNTIKNAIILIDEPEISLHIAWQQQLTRLIQQIIKDKDGMQVIITSHSPFISSGNHNLIVKAVLDSAEEK